MKPKTPTELIAHLQAWAKNWLPNHKIKIVPLCGDGSSRQFFRLHLEDLSAARHQTKILLYDAGWNLSANYPLIQKLLIRRELPVPKFEILDEKSGILVMEDLGDELLQLRLATASATETETWFRKALEILATLQAEFYPLQKDWSNINPPFSGQKFFEEFCYTENHLLKNFLGLTGFSEHQKGGARKFCDLLAETPPTLLCHRDYHTRNLLISSEELFFIDFQDARVGPPTYDLASLLYDAYSPITEEQRSRLLTHYKDFCRQFSFSQSIDWPKFEENLAAAALQRTFKAAGSFAAFYTVRKQETHLIYLKPVLELVQEILKKSWPSIEPFRECFPVEGWLEALEKQETSR